MEDRDIDLQIKADAHLSRDELVSRLFADIESAGHRHQQAVEARGTADRWRHYKEDRVASLRTVAAKRRLATEFGTERGWTIAKKRFGLLALKRGTAYSRVGSYTDAIADQLPHAFFDHPYFFRREGKAVAIAAHLYHFDQQAIDDFANQNGLAWETPDFPSWWYPGATRLVVFSRAKGTTGTTGSTFQ